MIVSTLEKQDRKGEKALAYSSMALAFMAIGTEADAQIVYTDVDPDQVLTQANFDIDFDNDGTVDVTISQATMTSSSIIIQVDGITIPSGGGVLGVLSTGYMYPNVLANAAPIAAGDAEWQTQSFGTLFYGTSSGGFGQWQGQSGFLGVRFQSGAGNTHYAWVELEVGMDGTQVTVKGYAYETTADATINAGDQGTSTGLIGAEEATLDLSLFPNPAVDHATLQFPAESTGPVQVRVLNEAGQQVLGSSVAQGAGMRQVQLDLGGIAPGNYVVETIQGERIARLKLVKR